jgi:tetratricopeptide (TPR) repeat protein
MRARSSGAGSRVLALLGGTMLAACSVAAGAAIEIDWGSVEDPRLREAIYDLNQEDYFAGIVRLVTNRNYVNLGPERDTVDLLLAALYLGYGMPDAAKDLLSEQLDKNSRADVQNLLWLQLAKARYQRGQIEDASTALNQIRGKMIKDSEIERRLVFAMVLIQQNQTKQAAEVLSVIDLKGNITATAFIRYNLAVALLKLNRFGEAMEQFKQISDMNTAQKDLLALKDQALIAAGFTLLRSKDPGQAKTYLEQVRSEGVLTGKAYLGLGWAYTMMDKHKLAIAAWSELEKRGISDPAALEATLAVPYAYSKLQAYRQAVNLYESAVTKLLDAEQKLDGLIGSVKSGKTTDVILRQGPMTSANSMAEYRRVVDADELSFLVPLLISYEFQEAHRNYLDMQTLGKKVQQWITALERAKNISPSFRESYMGRLVKHQTEVNNATKDLERYIKRLAMHQLATQKGRVTNYVAQARFAMAQIYDQAARSSGE